jgi:hypothetical protein
MLSFSAPDIRADATIGTAGPWLERADRDPHQVYTVSVHGSLFSEAQLTPSPSMRISKVRSKSKEL